MKDIIEETGFSHGVVYKYYKNLDDILIDLVNRINSKSTLGEKMTDLLKDADVKDWKSVIRKACKVFADDLVATDIAVLNFSIYCDALTIGDPERVLKMGDKIIGSSPLIVPATLITEYLTKVIAAEKLTPSRTVEEMIEFFIVGYNGIMNDYALSSALKMPDLKGKYMPEIMFGFLAEAIIGVLKGGENNE